MELDQVVDEQKQAIETLVDRIHAAKQSDPTADVQPLETQIDHLVYQLYNLTPEEISITGGALPRNMGFVGEGLDTISH